MVDWKNVGCTVGGMVAGGAALTLVGAPVAVGIGMAVTGACAIDMKDIMKDVKMLAALDQYKSAEGKPFQSEHATTPRAGQEKIQVAQR